MTITKCPICESKMDVVSQRWEGDKKFIHLSCPKCDYQMLAVTETKVYKKTNQLRLYITYFPKKLSAIWKSTGYIKRATNGGISAVLKKKVSK